jgi:putative nucleotidyltransferase with HDIG domain
MNENSSLTSLVGDRISPSDSNAPAAETADVSALVARLQKLPSYHPTAMALLGIATETVTAFEEFEAVFRTDPGFATGLLQIANSAAFGVRGRIDDIRRALSLLGLDRVSALAFQLATSFYFNSMPRMGDVQTIWSHSIATAIVAETLATASGLPGAAPYTAGLIHDVGRLGLLMTERNRYVGLSARQFPSTQEYLAAELASLTLPHTRAGGVMAEQWGLPQELCACIMQHHYHDPAPQGTAVLVGFACRLAGALGFGEGPYQQASTPEEILQELPSAVSGRLSPRQLQEKISMALQSVGR